MDSLGFLRMQLQLEGKAIIGEDSLRQVAVVPDEELPMMMIAQLENGKMVTYYDEALPTQLRTELMRRACGIPFPKIDQLFDLLKAQNILFEVGHFKTYIFPENDAASRDEPVHRFPRLDPKAKAFGFAGFAEFVYAIERDGRIVSACVSTRENDHCAEAWVYTDEEYRHQGFAQKAVSAWANGLFSAGKVPFYSHTIQNNASANLARRLRLQPVFEEIVISYMNV